MHNVPINELQRLKILHSMSALNMPTDKGLDALCTALKSAFNVEMGAVSLVAEDDVHFVAQDGLGVACANREGSFCHYSIMKTRPDDISEFICPIEDERFIHNPFVNGTNANLVYYCGAPIIVSGQTIGSFCVLSQQRTHVATLAEKTILTSLASVCGTLIESRKAIKDSIQLSSFLLKA